MNRPPLLASTDRCNNSTDTVVKKPPVFKSSYSSPS